MSTSKSAVKKGSGSDRSESTQKQKKGKSTSPTSNPKEVSSRRAALSLVNDILRDNFKGIQVYIIEDERSNISILANGQKLPAVVLVLPETELDNENKLVVSGNSGT